MEGRCQTVEFTGRKSWSLYEETNGKAIEKWIGRDESERRQAVGVKVNVWERTISGKMNVNKRNFQHRVQR